MHYALEIYLYRVYLILHYTHFLLHYVNRITTDTENNDRCSNRYRLMLPPSGGRINN